MLIAVDMQFTNHDSINRIGVAHITPSGKLIERTVTDNTERRGQRGVTGELFKQFKPFISNRRKPVSILTWGGPEVIALKYWFNKERYEHITLIDLEPIVNALFPMSSLKNISRVLGTRHRKSSFPAGDAKVILDIHSKMSEVTEEVKYSLDITRISNFFELVKTGKLQSFTVLREIGLAPLLEYLYRINDRYKYEEDKETWYREYRRGLVDNFKISKDRYREGRSEIEKVAHFKLKMGKLLTRSKALRTFYDIELTCNQLHRSEKGDIELLNLKRSKDSNRRDYQRGYRNMYTYQH